MKAVIHITRPELSEVERAKRMEEIKRATVRLVIATEKNRRMNGALQNPHR